MTAGGWAGRGRRSCRLDVLAWESVAGRGTPSPRCWVLRTSRRSRARRHRTHFRWIVVPLSRQRIGWMVATLTHRSRMERVLHPSSALGISMMTLSSTLSLVAGMAPCVC